MKNKWKNYALKDGKVQSSYVREYCNRKKVRKTAEAIDIDSNVKSGKNKEEVKLFHILPTDLRSTHGKVCEEQSARNEDSSERIVPMPDVSGKQVRSARKTRDSKKPNKGLPREGISKPIGKRDEISREEKPSETYKEGQQGIQEPVEGRPATEEANHEVKTGEEEVKEKVTAKERKHEAKESKAYEKKEDKREAKKESKSKKK